MNGQMLLRVIKLLLHKMFDTHSHINSNEFNFDREIIIKDLIKNNIKSVVVGTNIKDSILARDIVKKYSNFRFSAGVHPHESDKVDLVDVYINLEELVLDSNNVAIGECGFDFYYNEKKDLYKKQEDLLRVQIDIAQKYDKPLIIHTRESFQETYDILKEYENLKVVYHCFSGNLDWFYKLNSLLHKNYFSFSGIITFKNNVEDIQNTVKGVPLDQILSETDSPYLSPVPFRGEKNTPLKVKYIVQKISDLKGISNEEMEKILDNNASKVFNF